MDSVGSAPVNPDSVNPVPVNPASADAGLSNAEASPVPTWEELAHSHGSFIYGVAYRLSGNHHDAQDLVQEVLLRVRRGLSTYQPGNMNGWLSRITTNAFLDRLRKKKRRPTVSLPEDADRFIEGSPGVEAEIAARDLPDHLQQLLAALPVDYRLPVVLKDVLGFSYLEIAEQLNIPVGTVRSRIHRGRSRLRDALAA